MPVSDDSIEQLARQVEALVKVMGNGSPATTGGGVSGGSSLDLKKATGVIDKGALALASSFDHATPSIGTFANKFANVSNAVSSLARPVDDQVKNFRQLSSVGIDFGESLFESRNKAAQANLSLDTYSKTVADNAPKLALAFGTAADGADTFAKVSGTVMRKAGKDLAGLGFTMDEISEYSASYIEQMTYAGKAQTMSAEQLAAGSMKYNIELDKLSKATGLSRKEIDDANKARQADVRMRLAMQKLQGDEATEVTARITQLKNLGGPAAESAKGLQDLIASAGVAQTKEAAAVKLAMEKAGVDITSITRDMYNGVSGSGDKLIEAMAKAGQAANNLDESQRRLVTNTMTQGALIPDAVLAGFQAMGGAAESSAKAQNAQADAILKSNKDAAGYDPTRGALGMDQTLVQVQNSIAQTFLESGVMEGVAVGMETAGDAALALSEKFYEAGTSLDLSGMNVDEQFKTMFGKLNEVMVRNFMTSEEKAATSETQTTAQTPVTPDEIKAAAQQAAQQVVGDRTNVPPRTSDELIKEFKEKQKEEKKRLPENLEDTRQNAPGNISSFIDRLTTSIGDWFSGKTAEPPAPETPPTEDIPKLNTGTIGAFGSLFHDFGKETIAKLHGTEAVITPNQLESGLSGMMGQFANLKMPDNTGLENIASGFKDMETPMMTAMNTMATKMQSPEVSNAMSEAKTQVESLTANITGSANKKDYNQQVVDSLDQLNTHMLHLIALSENGNKFLGNTAKNTRQSLGNLI